MADHKDPAVPSEQPADEGEMSEAEIDRTLADTFPASDPPSWTLGTDHAKEPHTGQGEADEDVEAK